MNRKEEVVKIILQANDFVSVETIAKHCKTSTKTIRNDLVFLEPLIEQHHVRLVRKPGVGVYLEGDFFDKQQLLNTLKQPSPHSTYTPEQRRQHLLQSLLLNKSSQRMKDLELDYYVSRATIHADIATLNESLKAFQCEIVFDKTHGLQLMGDETHQRQVMAHFGPLEPLVEYVMDGSQKSKQTFIERFNDVLNLDFNDIEMIVNEAQHQLGYTFSTEASLNLIVHIAIAIQRAKQGFDVTLSDDLFSALSSQKEYDIAKVIAQRIERHFDVTLSSSETIYLCLHFLGAKRIKELQLKQLSISSDTQALEDTITRFIRKVQSSMGLFLENDAALFNSLLLHLKPTINRLMYGLSLQNPLYEEIKFNYSSIYSAVEQHSHLFNEVYHIHIPPNEIAYLVLHFAAAKERNVTMIRTLVMCASGLGTSQLIVSKLKRTFNNLQIVDVIASFDVSYYKEKDIDLIISTIPLESSIKTIVISPLLSDYDISMIKHSLVDVKKQPLPGMRFLPHHVWIDVDVSSKEEILQLMAEQLLQEGYVNEDYLQSILDREQLGPTLISSTLAIPHGEAKHVNQSVTLWVRLAQPMIWAMNESIQQLMLIASTQEDEAIHIQLMHNLMNHLEDESWEHHNLMITDSLSLAQKLNDDLCHLQTNKE
ncbi:MAG: transcription antiterminator [Erysipelothrix sp.]|nr:transcription antiterminator [Erysipelothrix sp.]